MPTCPVPFHTGKIEFYVSLSSFQGVGNFRQSMTRMAGSRASTSVLFGVLKPLQWIHLDAPSSARPPPHQLST